MFEVASLRYVAWMWFPCAVAPSSFFFSGRGATASFFFVDLDDALSRSGSRAALSRLKLKQPFCSSPRVLTKPEL